MATPFQDVYAFFMMKVRDYAFLKMSTTDLDEMLEDYLIVAVTKFKKCKKNLSDRNATLKVFNEDLNDEEKNILALFMVVEYLKPTLLDAKHKRLALTDKEFRMYSQANHIEEIRNTYIAFESEADRAMVNYTYNSLGDSLNE